MAAEPPKIDPLHPDPASEPGITTVATDSNNASDQGVTTGFVPSYHPPADSGKPVSDAVVAALKPGQCLDDFELVAVLGTGAFARVFLARQRSLDRQVALKVSANRGMEGRTLATLEHDHIVRVFSETVDPGLGLRLMCMQFIAGPTLECIIAKLRERPEPSWTGAAFLEIVDALRSQPASFDVAALRDRECLSECDTVEAVCFLGAKLAEALGYAHSSGVLHRDIKPANILINPYGRPFLADFNIALDPHRRHGTRDATFGGTLSYMAPEHLDAFNPEEPTTADAVDARSDVFSLGVVLTELFIGRNPLRRPSQCDLSASSLRALARERRLAAAAVSENPAIPKTFGRVLRRCLEADPVERYGTAPQLAQALDGCRQLHRIERDLPTIGPLTGFIDRRPFFMLFLLAFLPHLLGSMVNISYNAIRIVGNLSAEQAELFPRLVFFYNLILYPICIAIVYRFLARPFWVYRQLLRSRPVPAADVDAARRHMLRLPAWAVGLSALGWLPGAIFFPLVMDVTAGPVPAEVYGHFLVSFTISGLIAMTYSYFGVQLIVLRGLYPKLWGDTVNFAESAQRELSGRRLSLRWFQLLAGVIPLAGAVLMVGVGPETSGYRTFRVLVTALIALGMIGFGLAHAAYDILVRTLETFTGRDPRRQSS
jgi:serine/threonine protein kinase